MINLILWVLLVIYPSTSYECNESDYYEYTYDNIISYDDISHSNLMVSSTNKRESRSSDECYWICASCGIYETYEHIHYEILG